MLLPVLWLIGHLDPLLPGGLAARHTALQYSDLIMLLVWVASVLLTALVVGYVVALCARAIGYAAIRTLLSESQAQLYGLLASTILWVAITGLNWTHFRGNEAALLLWYVLAGAANGLFGVVWLVLAGRAAASLEQFRSAAVLFGSAVGSFFVALGALVGLSYLLRNTNPGPELGLYALILLIMMGLLVIPPVLTVAAGAALWGGILRKSDRDSGEDSGGDTPE